MVEKPVLVVIDDNAEFLAQLQKELPRYFDAFVIQVEKKSGVLDSIAETVRDASPDHLVLDVNLLTSGDSLTLLRRLVHSDSLPSHARIWLISQGSRAMPQDIVKQYKAVDARVENRLLPKPITPRSLWAELTEQDIFEPEPPWDVLPLPVRVLSYNGRVAWWNDRWANIDYPRPDEFIAPDSTMKVGRREFAGSFEGEDIAGFTLHSFPIEQQGKQFLAQIAVTQRLHPLADKLEKVVEQIFEAMALAGFHHGRFYRIRPLAHHEREQDYDKVLELVQLSYEPEKPISLPWRFPLDGELKRRVEEYYDVPADSGKLVYKIRGSEDDDKAEDPRIEELNERLGLHGIQSWLEVPVWMPDETSPHNGGKHQEDIRGWLFFDCLPPKGKTDEHNQPAGDPSVSEEKAKRVAPLLKNLVSILQDRLKQERRDDLWEYEQLMRQLDQRLVDEPDNKQRMEIVLDAIRELSEADSAVLVLESEGRDFLEVQAVAGGKAPKCLTGLRFSLEAEDHPVVEVWRTKKSMAWQEFCQSDRQQRFLNFLATKQTEYGLSKKEHKQFVEWVENTYSLLTMPVTIPGEEDERCIGGISLWFDEPVAITRCRFEKVEAVMQRVRWILQQYEKRAMQRLWDRALRHELKSSLHSALDYLNFLAEKHRVVRSDGDYRCAKLWLLAARDLAWNMLDYDKRNLSSSMGSFSPRSHIEEYCNLIDGCDTAEKVDWQFSPSLTDAFLWQPTLCGDETVFGRVVRVLLDNAIKFGKLSMGMETQQSLILSLAAWTEAEMWCFSVSNPGSLQDHEYDQPAVPGANVGLETARRWTRLFGGNLDLIDLPGNKVQAKLCWPLDEPLKDEEAEV